jgi:uncharacterized protein (TIGR03435 family)
MEYSARKMDFGRGILLAAAIAILFAVPLAGLAQAPAPSPAAVAPAAAPLLGADGKPLTFDIVSIREDNTEPTRQNPPQIGPTPDGYRLFGPPLTFVIRAAYLPSQGGAPFSPRQLTGVPAWLNSVHYQIVARVSEADLPRWKDPAQQPAMLRAMLQAMLADRFKLAVHRETKEVSVYDLTVAKNFKLGPNFKPSEAATLADIRQKHPDAANMVALGGAIVASGVSREHQMIFGATMPAFCTFLSTMVGRTVQDKTGLTGKYDIIYQQPPPPPPPPTSPLEGNVTAAPPDLSSQIYTIVQDLGLRLTGAKGQVETLVIDHLERPSQN